MQMAFPNISQHFPTFPIPIAIGIPQNECNGLFIGGFRFIDIILCLPLQPLAAGFDKATNYRKSKYKYLPFMIN